MPRTVADYALYAALTLVAVTVAGLVLADPSDPEEAKRGFRTWIGLPAHAALVALAFLAFLRALQAEGRVRAGLLFLTLGLAGFAFGEWTGFLYGLNGAKAPFPSLADVGYATMALGAMLGTSTMVMDEGRRSSNAHLTIALSCLFAIVVFFNFFMAPALSSHASHWMALALAYLYPTADGIAVTLALFVPWLARKSELLEGLIPVAFALILLATADAFSARAATSGATFPGSWIDVGYALAIAIFAWSLARFRIPRPRVDPLLRASTRA